MQRMRTNGLLLRPLVFLSGDVMGMNTDIEYADSTVNAQMGCNGCELWTRRVRTCYAGRIIETQAGRKGFPRHFNAPEIFDGRIQQAAKWANLTGTNRNDKPWLDEYPRIIFLNDMGDTFTESLPVDWLLPYISIIENSPHIWLILTKRAKRMATFFNTILGYVPHNVWPGVSITSSKTLKRLDYLLQLPATAVRWLSIEPFLDHIPFPNETFDQVDWLVVGGESGSTARPLTPQHVHALREKCVGRTAFFFKQWGEYSERQQQVGKVMAGRLLNGELVSQMPAYRPHGQLSLL